MAMYFFPFFMSCNFEFYLMNTLFYVNIDQGLMKKSIRHNFSDPNKLSLCISEMRRYIEGRQ